MDEQEKNNCIAFLERTTLTGKEVPAYNIILLHLLQAEEVEEVRNADTPIN
jgi:hypothetical protein